MKDFINQQNRNIYTKNMFVESHYELNISLFIRDLNEIIINEAYEKLLNEYVKCVEKKSGTNQDMPLSRLREEPVSQLKQFLSFYRKEY